jgi:hypothetical protein
MEPRFISHSYSDGVVITEQWCEDMDGPWPYPTEVTKVTFDHNIPNPLYPLEV